MKRAVRFAAAAAWVSALIGCQGVSGTPQAAQVRFIDASPDAGAIDIYQNPSQNTFTRVAPIAYNVGFGAVTSYVPTDPGFITFAFDSTGTTNLLVSDGGTIANSGQYTVIVGNVAAHMRMLILKDQATPAPAGQVEFRFLNEATRAGGLDVYLVPGGSTLTSVSPVLAGFGFSNLTGYISAPSGNYTIVVLPTGTVPSTVTAPGTPMAPLYTGPLTVYPGGAARTVLLIDQPFTAVPGVQVVSVDDFDSPATLIN